MTTVHEILSNKGHHVYGAAEDTTTLDAARLMNQHRIGALVVTRDEKMIGIFTERDLLNRVVVAQLDPAEVRVQEVMTTPVACCTPQTTRDECRTVMRTKRLRHLPVIENDRVVGMISIGDLYEATAAAQDATIQYLHDYLMSGR